MHTTAYLVAVALVALSMVGFACAGFQTLRLVRRPRAVRTARVAPAYVPNAPLPTHTDR